MKFRFDVFAICLLPLVLILGAGAAIIALCLMLLLTMNSPWLVSPEEKSQLTSAAKAFWSKCFRR